MLDSVFSPLVQFKSKSREARSVAPPTQLEKELDAIVDLFLDNTSKAVSSQINYFVSQNFNSIRKQDKKLLQDIDKLNFIPALQNSLFFLWNLGWNKGRQDGKKEINAQFSSSAIFADFADRIGDLENRRAALLKYLNSPSSIIEKAKRIVNGYPASEKPENARERREAIELESDIIRSNIQSNIDKIDNQIKTAKAPPVLEQVAKKVVTGDRYSKEAREINARRAKEKLITGQTGILTQLENKSFGQTYLNKRTNYIASNTNKTFKEAFKQPVKNFLDKNNTPNAATTFIKELRQKAVGSSFARRSELEGKRTFIQSLLGQKTSIVLNAEQRKKLDLKENEVVTIERLKELKQSTVAEMVSLGIADTTLKRIGVTELTHAYNLGRLEYFAQEGVAAVQWTADLETRGVDSPCRFCEMRNGVVVPLAQVLEVPQGISAFKRKDMWIIPYHPNCRCYWKPVRDPKQIPGKLTAAQIAANVAIPVGGFAVTQGLLSAYPMMQAFREQILREQSREKEKEYDTAKTAGIVVGSLLIPVAGYFVAKRLSNFFGAKQIVDVVTDAIRNKSAAALNQIKGYTQEQLIQIQEDLSNEAAAEILNIVALAKSDDLYLTENQTEEINKAINNTDSESDIIKKLIEAGVSEDKIPAALNTIEAARSAKQENSKSSQPKNISFQIPLNIKDPRVSEKIVEDFELEYIRDNILTSPANRRRINDYLTKSNTARTPTVSRITKDIAGEDTSALEDYFNKYKGVMTAKNQNRLDEVKRKADLTAKGITFKQIRGDEELLSSAKRLAGRANYVISRSSASKTANVLIDDLKKSETDLDSLLSSTKALDKRINELEIKIQKASERVAKQKTTRGVNTAGVDALDAYLETVDTQKESAVLLNQSKIVYKKLDSIKTNTDKVTASADAFLSQGNDIKRQAAELKVEIDLTLSNYTIPPETRSQLQKLSQQLEGGGGYIEQMAKRYNIVAEKKKVAQDYLYKNVNRVDAVVAGEKALADQYREKKSNIKQSKNNSFSLSNKSLNLAQFYNTHRVENRLIGLGKYFNSNKIIQNRLKSTLNFFDES